MLSRLAETVNQINVDMNSQMTVEVKRSYTCNNHDHVYWESHACGNACQLFSVCRSREKEVAISCHRNVYKLNVALRVTHVDLYMMLIWELFVHFQHLCDSDIQLLIPCTQHPSQPQYADSECMKYGVFI